MRMPNPERVPSVGDIVGIAGERGTWVISGVSHQKKTVNLGKIGSQQDAQRIGVSWESLAYRDQEDSSQAAFRIVGEATEGK